MSKSKMIIFLRLYFGIILAFIFIIPVYAQIAPVSQNEPADVTAGMAVYQYEIEKLLLENSNNTMPTIVQGSGTLKAQLIIYDSKKETGYAFRDVNYQNSKQQMVLTSGEGTYDTKKKEMIARVNPVLLMKKDGTKAKSDVIKIYPDKDNVIFIGNVWISNQKSIMTGDYATYMQKSGQFRITGKAGANQENSTMLADRIDVFSKNGTMENYTAIGNVKTTDKKEGYTLQSGRMDYYKELGYSRMTQNPSITFESKNFQAFSIVMEKYDQEDKANLLGNVVIVQNNKKAYAKWGVYYIKQKKIILTGNPVLVDNGSQFRSQKITVDLNTETMSMSGQGAGAFEYK